MCNPIRAAGNEWNVTPPGAANPEGWQFSHRIDPLQEERARRLSDGRHLEQWRGAHSKENGVLFQVFAPNARSVHLLLTAFGKEEHAIVLDRKETGVWEGFTHHASVGRTYRYCIENASGHWNCRTDPFGHSVEEKEGVCESVVSSVATYPWNDLAWMRERKEKSPIHQPLSIYELNVELWRKRDGQQIGFRDLAHQIVDYHNLFPFTHVELYGVLDHKNTCSWGYQVDHFFAVNRRMGQAGDFQYLVNLCHQRGIGVILDWIPTHYKHEHGADQSQSLYYYDGTDHFGGEHTSWGTMYFDFEKPETRRLLLASALYWLEEMHVDGFRIDAVGPMLKRHGDIKWPAVHFLKELNSLVHEQYPGVLMIAEETDGFPKVTRPVWEEGLGFDVKLATHMQHRSLNYFKTPYEERGQDQHHFGKLLANLNEMGKEERFLLAHSHDEAAGGAGHQHSTLYRCIPTEDAWRRFAEMRLFHGGNLLKPGVGHMIHMGDEIGQIWPWNERLSAHEGAVEWHLLNERHLGSDQHRSLLLYVGDLNRLYRAKPAFWKGADFGYRMISHCPKDKVLGYHRLDFEGGRLALFYNFTPMGYPQYDFPLPPLHEDPDLGWIRGAREIFNSDGTQYGGTGQFRNEWAFIVRNAAKEPTHFRLALPPLSLLVFEEIWE